MSIASRYVPAGLPDLTPPEYVDLPDTGERKAGEMLFLSVKYRDDLDNDAILDLDDAEKALTAVCEAFELDKPAEQRSQPEG